MRPDCQSKNQRPDKTSKQVRRHFSPSDKAAIVRRHLLEGTPISDLCDEFDLNPTVFYHWLKQLFENGAVAFQRPRDSSRKHEQERMAALEKKLRTKDEVLAELMEEHVALKKSLGEI